MKTNPLIHVRYSPPTLKAVQCSTYKAYNKSKISGQQHYMDSHASSCCVHDFQSQEKDWNQKKDEWKSRKLIFKIIPLF